MISKVVHSSTELNEEAAQLVDYKLGSFSK
jgi:hypothetical protein